MFNGSNYIVCIKDMMLYLLIFKIFLINFFSYFINVKDIVIVSVFGNWVVLGRRG